MWESVAKHMKNFGFKNTVCPKNVKGIFIFNDVDKKRGHFSENAAFLFFILPGFFSSPLNYCFSLLGKKISPNYMSLF